MSPLHKQPTIYTAPQTAPLSRGAGAQRLRGRGRQRREAEAFRRTRSMPVQLFVRVDAHIDPAGCTDFTKICGESVTSQWADRVVGPYNAASRSS